MFKKNNSEKDLRKEADKSSEKDLIKKTDKLDNNSEKDLIKKLDKLNRNLEDNNIFGLSELVWDNKKLFYKNFVSGIIKGVGISIGFTLVSAIIVFILQKIIRLNIPIISEYITDVVDIVEKNR